MKRTLALLLASILTCSVLLTSLPALETKVSAATNPVAGAVANEYHYEWTLRGELEKATINMNLDPKARDITFDNSLFAIEIGSGGSFSPMKKAYGSAFPEGNSVTFTTAFDGDNQNGWKKGATINEDGTFKSATEYPTGAVRLVFTAPVEGLYTLVPKQIPGKNVTAYAYSSVKLEEKYDSHATIYTDKETLSEGDILVRAAKQTDAFKQDCETCIELKKGDKLYIEFDSSKAESYIRNGKKANWQDGGCGVICNFSMVLNSYPNSSEVYAKSYGVGEYIKESAPSSYPEKKKNEKTGEYETVMVKDDKGNLVPKMIYCAQDGSNLSWPEWMGNGGTFFAEMKNPWDQTVWGRASRYNLNADGSTGFGYGSPAGKYQMTVTPENKVSMNTWTSSFDWRLGFTAPATDTYYINLSAVTATAMTDERVKFLIYTDAALNASGDLKSEDAAFRVYDFYKDRTSVEYPCKNGLLEIKLNAGQKIYFECDVTGGTSYKELLGVNYTLDIKTGKSVSNNVIYDNFYTYVGNGTTYRYDMGNVASDTTLDVNYERTPVYDSQNNVVPQPTPTIGNDIRWYSTNRAVATVDQSGIVTAHSGGVARIVAYNDFASSEMIVTVGPIIAPTSIAITDLVSSIDQYDRVKLGYKITAPDGATAVDVKWTSSDKNIIEVNEKGYITAKNIGTAVVTVTVDGVSADASITVNEHVCDNTKASWADIVKATCTEEGLQQLLCDKCFCVLDEMVVPAKGHTAKEEWITYPTWEKEGSIHIKCYICGYDAVETRAPGVVKDAVIKQKPSKVSYATDAQFDPTGMIIEVSYENYEHTTTVTDFSGVQFNYDFSVEGNTNVTFTLAGKDFSIPVTVNDGPVKYGDVDNNGAINTADTDLLMKYLSGYDVWIRSINADVQLDGDVDVADAVRIYQYLAGQITSFN